jgi:hypothetical protein
LSAAHPQGEVQPVPQAVEAGFLRLAGHATIVPEPGPPAAGAQIPPRVSLKPLFDLHRRITSAAQIRKAIHIPVTKIANAFFIVSSRQTRSTFSLSGRPK